MRKNARGWIARVQLEAGRRSRKNARRIGEEMMEEEKRKGGAKKDHTYTLTDECRRYLPRKAIGACPRPFILASVRSARAQRLH